MTPDPNVKPPTTLENVVVMAIWGAIGIGILLALAGIYEIAHLVLGLLNFVSHL